MSTYEDSRLSETNRERTQVRVEGVYFDRVFCPSCGKSMGASSPGLEHMIISCARCAESHGSIIVPDLPEAPASVARCRSCEAVGPADLIVPAGQVYFCDTCCETRGDPPGFVRVTPFQRSV